MSEKFVSLGDAARRLGIKRPSLYYHLDLLQIKTIKMDRDRHAYISVEDFRRIQASRRQARARKKK